MAAIKTVARSATVAFAPTVPDVLATGTLAGAIDASFSAAASLDVFKIDFSSPDSDLDLLSSYSCSEKFNSLSWGSTGAGSEESPYGLLASGLADGAVCIWNPAPLIRKDPNTEASLLAKLQKHVGLVRGLEFNVITPNLLASGGDDGDIYIWDLVNPTSPSHFPALRGGGQEHIVDLSWNRKVPQIMATTSNTGVSVVWDLRRQKSILSFTDPNNRRPCAALEWNPEGATQLIVASADDRSPSLQVWDLRNSISPVKELVGHTKGVVAMAWCPIDSALLLSSAKDYRTLCWDTVSGEIICELPVSSNWNFDVQWSPRIAGVLSTSSYDGRVNLYNIEACSRMLPSEGDFGGSVGAGASSASMRAPKWLKRPAGVSFGFQGKLVSFGVKKGASVSELNIQTLITEEDLIGRSKEFEAAIGDPGSRSSLRALCEKKAQESGSEDEKEVWSFLKIMFEENARTSLLHHLGFVPPSAEDSKVEEDASGVGDLNADMTEKLNLLNGTDEAISEDLGCLRAPDSHVQGNPIDDGADFFYNLPTPKGVVSPQLVPNVEKAVEDSVMLHEEDHEDGLDDEDDCDKAVQHALVIGDFKDAVKHCLSEKRMADALVIAHVGGSELWEETLAIYLRKHRRPYRKVLTAVVAHDIRNLVNNRPLNTWKETLALLCSYAGSQDWTMLCDALAARLHAAGCTQEALICYICAANIEELARIWYRDLLLNSNGAMFVKKLQDLMEKIVVLALAKGEKRVTPALARLVGSYAELLASQGVITVAMDYLGLVPHEESPEELLMLRNRIYSSKQGEVKPDPFLYSGNTQDAFPVPAVSSTSGQKAADLQAPPESMYTPYPSQGSSYEATQQGVFYHHAPDPIQGTSYPTYVPPPQEIPYSQPGMFYPTPPPVPDPSQPPPSLRQAPFVPPPVKSFTPVDPPSTGNSMALPNLFPSRGSAMAPSNQFSATGKAMAPPNQFSSMVNAVASPNQFSVGPGDWTSNAYSNAYSIPRPHQPATTPNQPTPNMMFTGSANSSIVSTPTPRGFMPVSAPRAPLAQQQPGMLTPAMQPQSPSSLSPPTAQPVPATAAPPVTIQSVETADVPADLKPVVATLSRLYNETTEALGGARANPAKKREIDDNSRKLGGLFARLNTADISLNARAKLIQICQCLDAGDYTSAMQLQVSLTTSDWDECGSWLSPLKRMIKTRQALR